jgi:hypothetical protein
MNLFITLLENVNKYATSAGKAALKRNIFTKRKKKQHKTNT